MLPLNAGVGVVVGKVVVVGYSDVVKAVVEVGAFVVVGDSDLVVAAWVVGTFVVVDNSDEVKAGRRDDSNAHPTAETAVGETSTKRG